MVTVKDTIKGSLADKAGMKSGDIIISVNGNDINDVLDYRYYITECVLNILVHRQDELLTFNIKKGEYDDIGLEFETYLMDKKHICKNKCIFCFIDQMPKGCRDALYFKDDDSRLSYLMGNYITLTNLVEHDIERIIKMKMCPINISVHTTDPKLRVFMMKNPNASKVMEIMRRFAEGNITMNAQIVLCKGINDKEALDRTMNDLYSLYPSLISVSVVPCGLTDHREGLYEIEPFSADDAKAVIGQVEKFGEKCKDETGTRLFYCGDEFYIKAGMEIPVPEFYDGYPQLENGVGMIALLNEEFADAIFDAEGDDIKREVSIATAKAPYPFICKLADLLKEKYKNTKINIYQIENKFFGKNITVAGLITGGDLISQLKGKILGDRLLIPEVMLKRDEPLFLDGVSLDDVKRELGCKVLTCSDGYEILENIIGEN